MKTTKFGPACSRKPSSSKTIPKSTPISFDLDEILQKSKYRVWLFIPVFFFIECIAQILIYARNTRSPFAERQFEEEDENFQGEVVGSVDVNRHEALFRWLNPESSTPLFGRCTDAVFHNRVDMECSLILTAAYEAAARVTIFVLLNDKDRLRTARLLKVKIRMIHHRAHTCKKQAFPLKDFISFLDDINNASVDSVALFIRELAFQFHQKPFGWISIILQESRCALYSNSNQIVIAFAGLAIYVAEGAGLDHYYLKGTWKNPDRIPICALNLLSWLLVDRFGNPHLINDKFNWCDIGIEGIVLSELQQSFKCGYSRGVPEYGSAYMVLVIADLVSNNYEKFLEVDWTKETLERMVWAIMYGKKHMSQKLYSGILEKKGCINLNLRRYNVKSLIFLSMTGMVSFTGYDACIFKLTAAKWTKVTVSALLPAPKVSELVEMGLMEDLKDGRYRTLHIPGIEGMHKAVRTGDRFLLVRSNANVPFKAEKWSKVA